MLIPRIRCLPGIARRRSSVRHMDLLMRFRSDAQVLLYDRTGLL
jgi:hypothetical protein